MTGINFSNAVATGSHHLRGSTFLQPYAPPSSTNYAYDNLQAKAGKIIYDILCGSQKAKRKREQCFESSITKKGKGRGKMKRRAATGNDPSSILKDCTDLVGGHTIQQQTMVATPLSMKLGKREYPNPVPTFLANLSSSGTVRCEWNGLLDSKVDQRAYFMTLFRHRLDNTATGNIPNRSIAYPLPTSAIGNTILYPTNSVPIDMTVTSDATTALTLKLDSHSIYDHVSGYAYWAPLNRPDYEDMSWNLNRLRLGQQSTVWNDTVDQGADLTEAFADDHTLFDTSATSDVAGMHRKISNIEQNNNRTSGLIGADTYLGAGYKYNMVFNFGTAHYYFLNKESTGCKVEVIVYKHKKTHRGPATVAALTPSRPMAPMIDSIAQGYLDTKMRALGTDDLEGRTPDAADVTTNPNYPFLPKLKLTKESNQPWAEVMRNTFVLPAGGRRAVDVQFPGEVYNPSDVPLVATTITPPTTGGGTPTSTEGNYPSQYYGMYDKYTYAVIICVNGVPTTRNIRTDMGPFQTPADPVTDPPIVVNFQPSDNLFGDCHDKANLQYYCSYTEHISGCQYQPGQRKQIFVRADAINPPTLGGTATLYTKAGPTYGTVNAIPAVHAEGVTILPVTQAVRNARTVNTNTEGGTISHSTNNQGQLNGSLCGS